MAKSKVLLDCCAYRTVGISPSLQLSDSAPEIVDLPVFQSNTMMLVTAEDCVLMAHVEI